ncbi:hypothetical protein AYL99_07073 [Fonsecaea erecta]|uniref:3-carboxymuconate cyclase n=1 Tax=Fonsecaea erecta TaxID=1367422 RepID=A0A178ZFL2_9EURO|nr:hypothetical protein AYL99_07073 [Fonsecaea erecta]OAP57983.1 hypothetical protein AYL99_07073 [Fonsecaea erecta]
MLKNLSQSVLLLAALTASVRAAPPHHGKWGKGHSQSAGARAIYFITNDASSSVAAVPVSPNGLLSEGSLTPTGGDGGVSINGATGNPLLPDPLISQSSVTIAGNNIFAVNAGSNTLSMLSIDPQDPTKLTLIGAPVSLPGQFPNTVAASASNRLVCVGTTGVTNGVSCSSFSEKGLGPMDGLRSFDLVQTTPPMGPTNSVSQVFFSEDESRLFATVKGNPAINTTGFFSVFPVQGGGWHGKPSLSTTDTRSSPAGTAVLFGSEVIAGTSKVFVTDASFGGAVISVDLTTNTASTVAKQVIAGQSATCWATISPVTGTAFVADVGVNRLVEMSLSDASIISILDLSANGDPGLIDMKAAGNFIYALAPGNGTTPPAVTVLDVSGGPGSAKQVQHFQLASMGVDKQAQGMAVF